MMLVYALIEKAGKIPSSLPSCYLVNLTILHFCIAIEVFYEKELTSFEHIAICNTISFISYYSVLACVGWLFMLGHDLNLRMIIFRCPNEMARDSLIRNTYESNHKKRQVWYFVLATLLPLLITAAVAGLVLMKNVGNFCAFKNPVDLPEKHFYIAAPLIVAVAITAGIYLTTGALALKVHNTDEIVPEHKRSVSSIHLTIVRNLTFLVFRNVLCRFWIIARLFVVVLTSIILFMASNLTKTEVVAVMNCLHLIALGSIIIENYWWVIKFLSKEHNFSFMIQQLKTKKF